MAVNNELDLTIKDNWTLDKLDLIAQAFGYFADDNFANALKSFIEDTVKPATVTKFLSIFAERHFSSWQPPLKKISLEK
jgi:hypothetical protein